MIVTPWPAMLRLAIGAWHIPPDAFWRLSLKEWRALTDDAPVAVTLDRTDLAALIALYPDTRP